VRIFEAFSVATALCAIVAHGEWYRPRAERFAAPGVIVFTGKPLASPIVLGDWAENQRLMTGLTRPTVATDAMLRGRPQIEIAMYWGGRWSQFATTPESLALLARIQRPQPGRYYPASHGKPAVWMFGPSGDMSGSTRIVSDEAAAILRRHGLPVAVE
jgi:hypothetical protein